MLTAELPKLYAPVADDFVRYEESFQRAIGSASASMLELVEHVCRYRGKQLRPALVFLAARAVGGEVTDDHIQAAVAIELIHTATLVHDDILDGAATRRSLPTSSALWGNESSVLLGDYLFATAYGVAASVETLHTARTLADATRVICMAEVNQLRNRGNIHLDRDTYMSIIEGKTATLYAVGAELGAVHAGATAAEIAALHSLGRNLGVAFQMADDVLDLLGDEGEVGKSLGTDLEKGTVTLPILHALEHASGPDRERIAALITDGYRTARGELRDLIEPYGSFDHARRVGQQLIEDGKRALGRFPESPAVEALHGIADYVMTRKL